MAGIPNPAEEAASLGSAPTNRIFKTSLRDTETVQNQAQIQATSNQYTDRVLLIYGENMLQYGRVIEQCTQDPATSQLQSQPITNICSTPIRSDANGMLLAGFSNQGHRHHHNITKTGQGVENFGGGDDKLKKYLQVSRERYKSARRIMKEESEKFEKSQHMMFSDLCNTKKALEEKTKECDEIRQRWQAAIGELNELKTSDLSFMIDDSEMTAKWKQLQYCVKNFSRHYLGTVIPKSRLSKPKKDLLIELSPKYEEFVATEGRVHLLFQSLIWRYLMHDILFNPLRVWGDELGGAAKLMRRIKQSSPKDFFAWRSQTAHILQGEIQYVDEKIDKELKDNLYSTVKQFISSKTLSRIPDENSISRTTDDIINKATELATIFNRSHCVYRVKYQYSGHVDPEVMELDDGNYDGSDLDLMISPALIKYGNCKGESLEHCIILVKMLVCRLDTQENKEKEGEKGDGDIDNGDDNHDNEQNHIGEDADCPMANAIEGANEKNANGIEVGQAIKENKDEGEVDDTIEADIPGSS